jgi:hypothetical protein
LPSVPSRETLATSASEMKRRCPIRIDRILLAAISPATCRSDTPQWSAASRRDHGLPGSRVGVGSAGRLAAVKSLATIRFTPGARNAGAKCVRADSEPNGTSRVVGVGNVSVVKCRRRERGRRRGGQRATRRPQSQYKTGNRPHSAASGRNSRISRFASPAGPTGRTRPPTGPVRRGSGPGQDQESAKMTRKMTRPRRNPPFPAGNSRYLRLPLGVFVQFDSGRPIWTELVSFHHSPIPSDWVASTPDDSTVRGGLYRLLNRLGRPVGDRFRDLKVVLVRDAGAIDDRLHHAVQWVDGV